MMNNQFINQILPNNTARYAQQLGQATVQQLINMTPEQAAEHGESAQRLLPSFEPEGSMYESIQYRAIAMEALSDPQRDELDVRLAITAMALASAPNAPQSEQMRAEIAALQHFSRPDTPLDFIIGTMFASVAGMDPLSDQSQRMLARISMLQTLEEYLLTGNLGLEPEAPPPTMVSPMPQNQIGMSSY